MKPCGKTGKAGKQEKRKTGKKKGEKTGKTGKVGRQEAKKENKEDRKTRKKGVQPRSGNAHPSGLKRNLFIDSYELTFFCCLISGSVSRRM